MRVQPGRARAGNKRIAGTKATLSKGVFRRMNIRTWIARLSLTDLRREGGQTMTEYGVLLALIAILVIAALLVLGPKIGNLFNSMSALL
jgi:pilus assembly protein Flp/PilA